MGRRLSPCVAIALAVAWVLLPVAAGAQVEFTVIGWNAESGDAHPDTVAALIRDTQGCDIWGMCEVQDAAWGDAFTAAAGHGENAQFAYVLGTTGSADRMAIIYNADRFTLAHSMELHRINVTGRARAPLVARFRINGTNTEFLFMINHLYRTRPEPRHVQARLLNRWAAEQTLPIIAVGDYNFDWEVHCGDINHDRGYDEMVSGGFFNWVRPRQLMKTQASPDYNSVLDFVFLGGDSWAWEAESTILARGARDSGGETLSDDEHVSDHRPVRATITIE